MHSLSSPGMNYSRDTSSSSAAPAAHPFMEWWSLVQQLLRDATPSQRERLFWDIYTQLAEYFSQPYSPLRNSDIFHNLTRYKEEFEEVIELGKGGFGRVMKARNKLDGCCYAIKIIVMDKGSVSPDQSLQEVRCLAMLNNPRVVRFHHAWLQLDLPARSSWGTASDSEEEDEDAINMTSTDRSRDDNGAVPGFPSCYQGSHASTSDSVVFQYSGNGQRRSLRQQGSRGGSASRALLSYCPPETVVQPQRTLYIQMGLCGESLKDWLDQRNIKKEPVARDRCMMIFRELTEALSYIHEQGLIHRDLKPANILFTLDGHHIQLGDFGLAKQSAPVPTSSPGATSNLAPLLAQRNTSRVGTPLYMAPEVDRGSNYGQKSDMFSAGVTLLELLSSFATYQERVHEIMSLREMRQLDPELSLRWPDIAGLILQLTDPDPASRPSSQELLTSPLFDPFPPPAITAGATVTSTPIPPYPEPFNGVLTMGDAVGGVETNHSKVNRIEKLKLSPVKESGTLEDSCIIERSSVVNPIQRQVSEAEENVILREEISRLKRRLAELEFIIQHLTVSNSAPPPPEK